MNRPILITIIALFAALSAQAQTPEFSTIFRELVSDLQDGNYSTTATQLPGKVLKSSLKRGNADDAAIADRIDMIYQIVYPHYQGSRSYTAIGDLVGEARGLYRLEMTYTNKQNITYTIYSAAEGKRNEYLVVIKDNQYRACIVDIVGTLTLDDVMTMTQGMGTK